MKVHTYFQPLEQIAFLEETKLHALWRQSWLSSEFIPITLTHQVAESHKDYERYLRLVSQFPTVNPPGYDLACWLRWLALDVTGGGLMTDYDVICRAFSAEDLQFPNPVTILDRGGVPCAVYTTVEGASQIVQDVLRVKHVFGEVNGRPHYSDMYFFQAQKYPRNENLVYTFGQENWQLAPAVHFSHSDVGRERPNKVRSRVVWDEMFKPFQPPSVVEDAPTPVSGGEPVKVA